MDVLVGEVFAEVRHHRVIRSKVLGDRWSRSQVVPRKSADGGIKGEKHIRAEQFLFKMIGLRFVNGQVGSNSPPAGDLPSAVGQPDFSRVLGDFALVILEQRNGLVVTLNQPAARSVVARDG